ncbi:uncharacterized protein [Amphiura filiformis]|uniref:uncharacterized protein n=1 Tax=Amphiura filiformis TaxID=82378 RepID=UPI003B213EE6
MAEKSSGKSSSNESRGRDSRDCEASSASVTAKDDNQSISADGDDDNMIHNFDHDNGSDAVHSGYESEKSDDEENINSHSPAFGSLSPTRHSTPIQKAASKRNAGSLHSHHNSTTCDQPAGKRIAVEHMESEESFLNLTSRMETRDDGKAKFLRLAFRENTYMFPCKKKGDSRGTIQQNIKVNHLL